MITTQQASSFKVIITVFFLAAHLGNGNAANTINGAIPNLKICCAISLEIDGMTFTGGYTGQYDTWQVAVVADLYGPFVQNQQLCNITADLYLDSNYGDYTSRFRQRHLIWYVPEGKLIERLKHPTTPGSPTFGTDKGDQLEPPLLDTSNCISVIAARFKSSSVG